METGFEHLGIDELKRQIDMAYHHYDFKLLECLENELDGRDIETYEVEQAEARFGA